MSDNVEEVQESTPEPQGQVEAQPQQQPQEPQNLSEQPQEGGHIRPENIPEKFWNAETGEIRTDELLKSNAHLEQFVGGKKEELRDQIIDELSNEADAEVPEEYALPALPEEITEEQVVENPLFDWWMDHCKENAYNQEMFEDGINKFINAQGHYKPNLEEETNKLGENANARIDAVDAFAQSHFGADDYELLQSTLGQSAQGIEILERVMQMQNQNISNAPTEPANRLTISDVRQMMKDPRYFDPKERDESYVKRVDDAFQRLYR
nr:scaffolding protein [uncultured Mediterranean phage uvMED]